VGNRCHACSPEPDSEEDDSAMKALHDLHEQELRDEQEIYLPMDCGRMFRRQETGQRS
jgi:hypothetical protein